MPENQQPNLNYKGVHRSPTRKESQEATSYQSNIGLNLDPNAQQHHEENLSILNDIDFGECKRILKDYEALLQEPIVVQKCNHVFMMSRVISTTFECGILKQQPSVKQQK